ncbi:taste receptor type 2 member 1-like [Rhineura floridana]|uniref:taste receptor type 2 member 1-like n=1 Tax=Rhineura floridana TaxID=261503 RepID=UPI002AC8643D|nr:taste receptor type 2 member 1-like [Rhineura floridana]
MPSPQITAFLVAVVDLALGGFISNGFIVAVIVTEWAKSRTLATSEQLLSLGMSNVCVTVLLTAFLINYFLVDDFGNHLMLQFLYLFATFVIFSRFWLTAWLCVFYCIKIVNSTQSLFLWCKLRISKLVPWLLVGSQVFSLVLSFFAMQNKHIQRQSNTAVNNTNVTQGKTQPDLASSFKVFFLITGSGCSLLVVLISSVVVVASLCRHVCKMSGKEPNLWSLQTEAHIKAAGTVLSLLILYISFYVAHTLIVTADFEKIQKKFALLVCSAVMMMYSPAQAIILVLVNPKLKQTATRMLPRTKP